MKWKVAVISGSLGALVAFTVATPPVRVAVTNVWERTPAIHRETSAHVLFVGDIMLSRSVGDVMAARDDWTWPFQYIASATAGAAITFGNLESVISDQGAAQGCTYCFRADPRAMQGLLSAGFDVVSVANNHAWDFGGDAFSDSLRRLQDAGIIPVGGGNAARARAPITVSAGSTHVAYLAYTNLVPASVCATDTRVGVNCYDAEGMVRDITAARSVADLVVVSFHAGEEYVPHTAQQQRIYRAAIDAGADLVIGHHPHVVQDVERYGAGWIAYSLGNFIFDQSWSPETMQGLLLDVTVNNGTITNVATRSVDISTTYQASLP